MPFVLSFPLFLRSHFWSETEKHFRNQHRASSLPQELEKGTKIIFLSFLLSLSGGGGRCEFFSSLFFKTEKKQKKKNSSLFPSFFTLRRSSRCRKRRCRSRPAARAPARPASFQRSVRPWCRCAEEPARACGARATVAARRKWRRLEQQQRKQATKQQQPPRPRCCGGPCEAEEAA